MLKLGGFNLTKWTSSKRDVLAALRPFGLATPTLDLDLEKLPLERTLGVMWDSELDVLTFKIKKRPETELCLTKRMFLSVITSIYDPLGLVAPVIFLMKSLLQEIWKYPKKIGWDDELPMELSDKFKRWYNQLHHLETVKIPRCLKFQRGTFVDQRLHVFTDASEKGYGAVAYVKTIYKSGFADVAFVMAKTHVTPTKGLTIPRLELQGAVEGLGLSITICRKLGFDIAKVTFHVDSQTVLRWIHSKTCKFEVFVNNRIGKILRNTKRKQWCYVAGGDNPADLCSRGIEFHNSPQFLYYDPSEWPTWPELEEPDEEDVNVIRICKIQVKEEDHVIDNCIADHSSDLRIKRVLAWCLRFINNLRAKKNGLKPTLQELTVEEMDRALALCIRRAQEIAFPEEVYALHKGLDLPLNSNLRSLKPYLDGLGQMRVGGRLTNAPIDYASKHPVILSPRQTITRRLIEGHHVRNFHMKTERLLCHLRSRYWIVSGRQAIKSVLINCIPCRRRDVQPSPQIMGSLPVHRLTPFMPAFAYTGVDLFGPVTVAMGGRGRRHEKRWVCLFTCLMTRAVHLEVSTGLSLEDFLLCFSRFKSLRGKPVVVYSDNGTNFVAANKELKEAFKELRQRYNELETSMACEDIVWHFSPPHGPHFGGVWKRLVQTCKKTIRVKLCNHLVTEPVLLTVVAEVASLINSRPLTHLSVDPDDPDPLTPNHFLCGGPRP